MNTTIVKTNDGSDTILNKDINECYHSKHGAIVEAKHIFIKNGLLNFKKNKTKILEVGFGSGLNTLLTLIKAKKNNIKIIYDTIEPFPLNKEIYEQLNYYKILDTSRDLFLKIHNCLWEKRIKINDFFFIKKQKTSLSNFNSNIKYDIIYFDAFSPRKQPEMWSEHILTKTYNLLNKNGYLITYCSKGSFKRILNKIGYDIEIINGPIGKREITRASRK